MNAVVSTTATHFGGGAISQTIAVKGSPHDIPDAASGLCSPTGT
jgi:hypothetical protein